MNWKRWHKCWLIDAEKGRMVCIYTHKWSCRLNALPHIVHTYFLSSLCVSLCFVSADALLNTFPQTCRQKPCYVSARLCADAPSLTIGLIGYLRFQGYTIFRSYVLNICLRKYLNIFYRYIMRIKQNILKFHSCRALIFCNCRFVLNFINLIIAVVSHHGANKITKIWIFWHHMYVKSYLININ